MRTLVSSQLIEQCGIDYFKEGSSFGALSEKAIRYLLEEGDVLQLDKGDRLFEYGDPGDSFYIILKGAIQYFRHHQDKDIYIRDFVFGEEMGLVAMIALHNRIGSAQGAEDSIVLKVSCALFSDLHDILPIDFGIFLLNLSRGMARRIQALGDMLVECDIYQ